MKFVVTFIGLAVVGLITWFLLTTSTEDSHLSHREYVPPVTSTNPDELDSIEGIIDTSGNEKVGDVLAAVYTDVYAIYPCQNNQNHQALLLTAEYQQSASGNTFSHTVAAVRAWEPYVLQDIGHILYLEREGVIQDSSELVFSNVADRNYRYAEVAVEGETLSVYYGWLLNYAIFAPTLSCLDQTMNNVYEVGA